MNHDLQNFYADLGIIHETSCTYTPRQNDVAERRIGLIQERGRALLIHSNTPSFVRGEAIVTAAYLTNRTADQNLNTQSPLQLLSPAFPLIKLEDGLSKRVFGCVCYVHLYPNRLMNYHPEQLNAYFWDSQIHKKDVSVTILLDREF